MDVSMCLSNAGSATKKMLFSPLCLKNWFLWSFVLMFATDQLLYMLQANSYIKANVLQGLGRFFHSNTTWGGVIVFFIFFFFALILFYLKCRFQLVLIEQCVYGNTAIVKPFRNYKKAANSFFIGQIMILFAVFAIFFLGFIGCRMIVHHAPSEMVSSFNNFCLFAMVIYSIVAVALVGSFVSFGPVILYNNQGKFWQAFKMFLFFGMKHFGALCLFCFIKLLIYFVFGVAVYALNALTLGVLYSIFMIPVIGFMIVLPFYIFNQMFTLDFVNSNLDNPNWSKLEQNDEDCC